MPYPTQHTKPNPSNFSTSPQKPSLLSLVSPQSAQPSNLYNHNNNSFSHLSFHPKPPITHTPDPDTKHRPHKSKEAELIFFSPPSKNRPKGERKHTSQNRLQPYPFVDLVHARALAPNHCLHVKLLRTGESGSRGQGEPSSGPSRR